MNSTCTLVWNILVNNSRSRIPEKNHWHHLRIFWSFIFAFGCILSPLTATPISELRGTVRDIVTGTPLAGVRIYLSDLKRGAVSKTDGSYAISNLPQVVTTVRVSLIGYKVIVENINLQQVSERDFVLQESVVETNEVVVSGPSQATERKHSPIAVVNVTEEDLAQTTSTNIIDALARQPGVDQITTGSAISKPIIRGLGFNRVVVVNDGVRQEGQQWGDEHGIEVDPFSVNSIEILKGPASLLFGSDAMAGVVNLLSAPTLPEGKWKMSLATNYLSNNGQSGLTLNSSANVHGILCDLRYSRTTAHSYRNEFDGYVFNSGFKEQSFKTLLGINEAWGYIHALVSLYQQQPGIVEGERDSIGHFVKSVRLNDTTIGTERALENDFLMVQPVTPYQKISHQKVVIENNLFIGDVNFKTTVGWQQNQRQEFTDPLQDSQYGLSLLLRTLSYSLSCQLSPQNFVDITFGLSGMYQTSKNEGIEFLIPDYDLFDIGAFTVIKKTIQDFDFSAGLRIDSRSQHGFELSLDSSGNRVSPSSPGANKLFNDFHLRFNGVSGSVGACYQFSDELFFKLNLSKGFRSPNISELSSNGIHEGTSRYEIGNTELKAEQSLQFDLGIGYNIEHLSIELSLFANSIDNFIYSRRLQNSFGGDSVIQATPCYKFVRGNALLEGGELVVDFHPHPLDWLHFENSFAFVRSVQDQQSDSTKYLPFRPAPKLSSSLKAQFQSPSAHIAQLYFTIGVDHTFDQREIYSAFGTETSTPAFTLVHAGLGAQVRIHDSMICSISLSVENALNVSYQNHLSRLKYTPVNQQSGRVGVFNMGRTFAMKLQVPIDIL